MWISGRWRLTGACLLEERKRAYLEAVGNPYAVRVGDMKVRVQFAEDGGSFEEAFENMLRNV